MAKAAFRPDLLNSVDRTTGEMRRLASDIDEIVIVTRELIEATLARIREADRLLQQR